MPFQKTTISCLMVLMLRLTHAFLIKAGQLKRLESPGREDASSRFVHYSTLTADHSVISELLPCCKRRRHSMSEIVLARSFVIGVLICCSR